MLDNYEDLFDYDLLRLMLIHAKQINISSDKDEVFKAFHIWLERNKQYRKEVKQLSSKQLKEYVNLIKKDFDKIKDDSDAVFPFDLVKFHLREYLKSINPPKGILERLNEEAESKIPKLRPYSFSEFINLEDKKEYYVKDMFAKGTINMIFSPPASMKSFVSYKLGLCLAAGKDFLNQKTKKVSVCYFDWENPLSDIQNRVKGLCKGLDIDMETMDNFFFFPKNPVLLRVERYDSYVYSDLKEELINFLKDNNIKVIFFDTLRRLGNFDENDSKAINTIKSELFDPIINETEACIIFLHHTSKEGINYRGSVDIEGILDTSYSINKKIKDDLIYLTMKNVKRRNNELEQLDMIVEIENISYEDDDGDMLEMIDKVKFLRTQEAIEDKPKNDYSRYRQFFIDNLNISKQYKNKNFLDMIENEFNIKKGTANKIIKWLVNIKLLKEFGENKNKYYILNPLNVHKEQIDQALELEIHFKKMFKDNDLLEIKLLKEKFEEEHYSLLINNWISKGYLNPAKNGYVQATELLKTELDQEISIDDIDMEDLT